MTYHLTAIATAVALLVYFWMALQVAGARRKTGIQAPAMTGDPSLERTIRAHYNTLEWLPIFLPSLWLFAIYWGDAPAAIGGAIWILGRIIYFLGYAAEASRRSIGFLIQTLTALALLLGALGKAGWMLALAG